MDLWTYAYLRFDQIAYFSVSIWPRAGCLSEFTIVRAGTAIADVSHMGVKTLEELAAYQLALEFKRGVYRLVRASPEAYRDYRWRSQLFEAARGGESNIAEGWRRFQKRQICQFLRYALASLEEARRCLEDGVDRGYFSAEDCKTLVVLARRCGGATLALLRSLEKL